MKKVTNLFETDRLTDPGLSFVIRLPPKGQMRDRIGTCTINVKGRPVTKARSYKDKNQKLEESKILSLSMPHAPPRPYDCALLLGLRAYIPIPKTRPKYYDCKQKEWVERAATGEFRPITTPDLDNIIKNIKDALNGRFWTDDKIIVGYLPGTGKYYSVDPRYEIEILPA